MESVTAPFSDLIAGYVVRCDDEDSFILKTSDGREFLIHLKANTSAQLIRNFDDPPTYPDIKDLLGPGCHLFVYGVFYPQHGEHIFEAQSLIFAGPRPGEYPFESKDWWVRQIRSLGDFYLKAQFGSGLVDYSNYRVTIKLSGEKPADKYRQETDTISRLVYGFATAYLLTGEDKYLVGAERGTEYLRRYLAFHDNDSKVLYWYHGIDVNGHQIKRVFASEFGEDLYAIPAYEQIYALVGQVQTYRVTGDPLILSDAEKTVDLFERYFKDKKKGGYFSHLYPNDLNPCNESLGHNKARKNWNSIGDHAPAYLINLYLATADERYAHMLEYIFDAIEQHFPSRDGNPFVEERFDENWVPDHTHLWQRNRAVVGHNLKIAWNMMRMCGLKRKDKYVEFARKIARDMPAVGSDRQRGGWYDVVERVKGEGEEFHRFAFHDRKAWWQQEQAILAYLILFGTLGDDEYQRHAREAGAFYNAFFLDHDDGGIYFNVLANGIPYLMGNERFKGSHAMSGYHSFELCYLAQVYTNLLITKQPLNLYFRPVRGGFKGGQLRVAPDLLPPERVRLSHVWIDGKPYDHFDPKAMVVRLPEAHERLYVKVCLMPVT